MSQKKPVEYNHFIPCYWTAYWNIEYLNAKRNNKETKSSRKVEISYLNLKVNKILKTKAEKIFVNKYQGLAIIENENDLKKLGDNIIVHNDSDDENQYNLLLFDFENHFTEYENISRPALTRTIINKKIKDIEDKTFLAQFFILQSIRNPIILNKRLDFFQKNGKDKTDLLLEVRDLFTNRNKFENLILPIIFSKWIVYSVNENIFPLPDKPILDNKNHIFVPLAPDMLIEIQLNNRTDNIASYNYKIRPLKYLKFKNRVIRNVNNEIVGNTDLLMKWRKNKNLVNKELK
jgi:hypothetical protein